MLRQGTKAFEPPKNFSSPFLCRSPIAFSLAPFFYVYRALFPLFRSFVVQAAQAAGKVSWDFEKRYACDCVAPSSMNPPPHTHPLTNVNTCR